MDSASASLNPRLTEGQLGQAFGQLPTVALLRFDTGMRFVSVHGGALERLGMLAGGLIGACPRELGGCWTALLTPFAAALDGRRDASTGTLEWAPDPNIVYAAAVSPLRDERARIIGGMCVLHDISAARAMESAVAQAERDARTLVEFAGDMLVRTDPDGRYLYASPSALAVIGWAPETLVGRRLRDLVHDEDVALFDAAGREMVQSGSAELECRVRRPDGGCEWVHALLRARRDEHGRLIEVVRTVRNVSAQKAQQAALTQATESFESAFEHAPIGMALLGLDGSWMKVNRALCALTGYSEAKLLSKRFADITHPEDSDLSQQAFEGLLAGKTFEGEKRYLHADGHVIWVQVASTVVSDEHGSPQHFIAQVQDITERKLFQERLVYLAEHDPLTDLYNRRRFESDLQRQVELCQRYGDQAALIMLDLDHFKYLNDSLGHTVGDRIIKHAGQVLAARLRSSDVLARLGGDEYAVIFPRADLDYALRTAAELVARIEQQPFEHASQRYSLSASAGVLALNARTVSAEDALVNVDVALYDAKRHGRNRVAGSSPDTRADVLAGLSWSQRLKEALSEGSFVLHAQPIVDLQTGVVVIDELLIRMLAADGELIAPGDFLPAARRFGFMPAIDRWVISQAAALAAASRGRRLAVNLAANTIAEPTLVPYITQTLADAGANPADLVFEVSEADVIANLDHAASVCERLRELGATVALDDFGSGFSGFSYLKAMKVDLLKIDGQFVKELASNRVDGLIVEAILHVANGMDLPTVAEYVTDGAVAQRCRELGATYGQGFHLGKPAALAPLINDGDQIAGLNRSPSEGQILVVTAAQLHRTDAPLGDIPVSIDPLSDLRLRGESGHRARGCG